MAFAGAFGANRAAMAFDDIADDRQSDSQSSVHSCRKTSCLPETFENMRQEFSTDSNAGVTYTDVRPSRRVFQPHLDCTALAGELDGIR